MVSSIVRSGILFPSFLTPDDLAAAGLMHEALHGAVRYRGEPMIAASHQNSTAQHIDGAHRLATKLLGDIEPADKRHALLADIHAMLEVHDWGEAFIEPYSVAETQKKKGTKQEGAERKIALYALQAAYEGEDRFRTIVNDVRSRLLHEQPENVEDFILTYISENPNPLPSPRIAQAMAQWMVYYDRIEDAANRRQDFNAAVAKVLERMEGQLYYMDHAGKDGAASLKQSSSDRILKNLSRAESDVGLLFALSEGDSFKRAIATRMADGIYSMNISFITQSTDIINRNAAYNLEPFTWPAHDETRAQAMQSYHASHLQQQSKHKDRHTAFLDLEGDTVTAGQLILVYEAVKEAIHHGGYSPAIGEVVSEMRHLPEAVRQEALRCLERQHNASLTTQPV